METQFLLTLKAKFKDLCKFMEHIDNFALTIPKNGFEKKKLSGPASYGFWPLRPEQGI